MAKFVLVAIRDRAIDAYGRPFVVPHIGVAIRGFTDEINDPKSQSELFRHADDYDLYELGEFDDSDGSFALLKLPKMVITGKQVKVPASV